MVVESLPSDVAVIINRSISISCSASGVPLPSISWSKTEDLISGVDYIISSNSSDQFNVSVLTIRAAVQGDTGQYTCRVRNSFSTDHATLNLQVLGKISLYHVQESFYCHDFCT